MSRTNFDYLFKATAPIGERSSFALPRPEEALPLFDEHLNKASSATFGSSMDTAARRDAPVPTSGGSTSDHDAASSDASRNNLVSAAADTSRDNYDSEANAANDSDDEDRVEVSEIAAAAVESKVASAVAEVNATVEEHTVKSAGETAAPLESAEKTAKSDHEEGRTRAKHSSSDSLKTVGDAPAKVDAASAELSTAEEVSSDAAAGTAKSKAGGTSSGSNAMGAGDHATLNADAIVASVDEAAPTKIAGDGSQQPKADGAALPAEKFYDPTAGTDTSDSEKASHSTVRDTDVIEAVVNKVAAVAVPTAGPNARENGAGKESNDGAAPAKTIVARSADATEAANRLQPNGSAAKRAAQAGGDVDLPRVDPARFVGRVAKAMQTANERGGTLQLRLSPPELGAMRIELTVKDGVMTANLETENAAARRVLLEHLPALRERLAEQNIRVERFDVDVRREGTGGQADPRAAQDEQHSQQDNTNRRAPASRMTVVQPAHVATALPQNITTNTGINVVA